MNPEAMEALCWALTSVKRAREHLATPSEAIKCELDTCVAALEKAAASVAVYRP